MFVNSKKRSKGFEYIIMFLTLLTVCSTYYLHWQNLPTTGSGSLKKTNFLEPVRLDNGPRLFIKSTGPVSDGFSEPVLPIDIVGSAGPVGIVGLLEHITGPVSDGASEHVVPIDIAGPAKLLEPINGPVVDGSSEPVVPIAELVGLLEPKIVVAVPTCNCIGYVQLTSSVFTSNLR